jgi:hypothetical protein
MMAKLYPETKNNKKLSIENTLFLNIIKNDDGKVTQASIINMLSPIKCEILYNKYVTSGLKKCKDMKKEERFACESSLTEEQLINDVNKILKLDVNRDKIIWTFDNYKEINIMTNSIKHFYDLNEFNDIITFLNYKANEDLTYSADFKDSFTINIFCLSFMFLKNNFV